MFSASVNGTIDWLMGKLHKNLKSTGNLVPFAPSYFCRLHLPQWCGCTASQQWIIFAGTDTCQNQSTRRLHWDVQWLKPRTRETRRGELIVLLEACPYNPSEREESSKKTNDVLRAKERRLLFKLHEVNWFDSLYTDPALGSCPPSISMKVHLMILSLPLGARHSI